MHECGLFKMPSSNPEFWEKKLSTNRSRDQKNIHALLAEGWKVLTIWECSVRGADALRRLERNMDRVAVWIRSNTRKNHCVLSGTGFTCSNYDYEGN
jgi:DNA mismatch endonuclease (patch repair protein)